MSAARPVRRTYDFGERRPVVATIHPDGVVEFREKGRRRSFCAHLRALYFAAVKQAVETDRESRQAERRAARRGG